MKYDSCPSIGLFFGETRNCWNEKLSLEISYQFLKIVVMFPHCYQEKLFAEHYFVNWKYPDIPPSPPPPNCFYRKGGKYD